MNRRGIVTEVILTTEQEMLKLYGPREDLNGEPRWNWSGYGLKVYVEENQTTYFIHFKDIYEQKTWQNNRCSTIPGLEYSHYRQKYNQTNKSNLLDRMNDKYEVGKVIEFQANETTKTGKIYPLYDHFTSKKKYTKWLKTNKSTKVQKIV
jgi:hypothetical protein